MIPESLTHLAELSNILAPSGGETEVRKWLIPQLKTLNADLSLDTMGNVYVRKPATNPSKLTVLLTAHMDEVGFMITRITGDGVLKFEPIGGVDVRILPGASVIIGQNRLPGVIGLEAIHHTPPESRNKAPSFDSLMIDIGATSKEAALAKVAIGDFVTFDSQFEALSNVTEDGLQGVVKGKALDNRVGCAVLLEVLRQDHPVNVVGVFTVQEEIGLRGGSVAAHRVDPDFALVLECTIADDQPFDPKKEIRYPRLGGGPCLTLQDRSYIPARPYVQMVEEIAAAADIPYQYKRPGVGGTEAGTIHRSKGGIPAVIIAPAARYIHSPHALLDLGDFWNTVNLVNATLAALPEKWPPAS